MEVTLVTSKRRVTIPKELRQQLGIRKGSRIDFSLVGDQAKVRVGSSPPSETGSGFGTLKSRPAAVRTDGLRPCHGGQTRAQAMISLDTFSSPGPTSTTMRTPGLNSNAWAHAAFSSRGSP